MNQTLINYKILYLNTINLLSYIQYYGKQIIRLYRVYSSDKRHFFFFGDFPHLILKESYENDWTNSRIYALKVENVLNI